MRVLLQLRGGAVRVLLQLRGSRMHAGRRDAHSPPRCLPGHLPQGLKAAGGSLQAVNSRVQIHRLLLLQGHNPRQRSHSRKVSESCTLSCSR